MKHGLMFVSLALVAALLLAPAAFAAQDTDPVNSAITTTGPGADIAVGSDGKLYASFGQESTLKVFSGSRGTSLSQQYTVNVGDSARITAIALSKSDTVFVAVLGGSLTGTSGETNVRLYAATSASNIALANGGFVNVDTVVGIGATDSLVVNAIDMVANESFVIVATTVQRRGYLGSLVDNSLVDTGISTTINVYQYDTATNGIPILAHVAALSHLPDSDVRYLGSASNLQLVLDPVENANNGTTVVWLVQTMHYPAGAAANQAESVGVSLNKLYVGTAGSRGSVTSIQNIFHGLGDSQAIGRVVAENVTGSDTRARVTVSIVNDTINSGQINVIEFGDSRTSVLQPDKAFFGPVATGASDSVVRVDFDTGVSSLLTQVRAFTYGRTGSGHAWVLTLAGGVGGVVPTAAGDTVIALSQSSLGSASFTFDTATTSAGYTEAFNDAKRGKGYGMAISSNTLYSIGFDGGPGLVFYTTQGGSADTKKKDSGVCLMDRLFGRTSLAKAVFPGLKSFRDTLLGTNLGRKVVSLYYSF